MRWTQKQVVDALEVYGPDYLFIFVPAKARVRRFKASPNGFVTCRWIWGGGEFWCLSCFLPGESSINIAVRRMFEYDGGHAGKYTIVTSTGVVLSPPKPKKKAKKKAVSTKKKKKKKVKR